MRSSHRLCGFIAAVIVSVIAAGQPLHAGVTVTNSSLDAFAQALSGKAGSVDGTNTTDPAPTGGTYGDFTNDAQASAGPIPLNPDSVPFPGTTGVSLASSLNSLSVAESGGQTTIDVSLLNQIDFLTPDGGTYLAGANSQFSVDFTLTAITPYFLTGFTAWDSGDSLGIVRIEGSGVLIFSPKDGAPHPLNLSGTLGPGSYTFSGSTAVFAVGTVGEVSALSVTLVLAPEPASAALLLPTALVAFARRRSSHC